MSERRLDASARGPEPALQRIAGSHDRQGGGGVGIWERHGWQTDH